VRPLCHQQQTKYCCHCDNRLGPKAFIGLRVPASCGEPTAFQLPRNGSFEEGSGNLGMRAVALCLAARTDRPIDYADERFELRKPARRPHKTAQANQRLLRISCRRIGMASIVLNRRRVLIALLLWSLLPPSLPTRIARNSRPVTP
jgi:hypothetical protein